MYTQSYTYTHSHMHLQNTRQATRTGEHSLFRRYYKAGMSSLKEEAPFDLQSYCVCVSFTALYEHNPYGRLRLQVLLAWLLSVLAATLLPQLITDIQENARDFSGCAAACFRGVPEAALCTAAWRRSSWAGSQTKKRQGNLVHFRNKTPCAD